MSKKSKSIALIIIGFLLSLFLFELFFGVGEFNSLTSDNYGPFVVFEPIVKAGIYHFIFISLIAIIAWFAEIEKTYKKILAYLPVYTIVLTLPVSMLAMRFALFFGMFGLNS